MSAPSRVSRFVVMSAALHGAALVLTLSLVSAPAPTAIGAALARFNTTCESALSAANTAPGALCPLPAPSVSHRPLAPPSIMFREEAPQAEPAVEVPAEPEAFEPFTTSAPPESPARLDLPSKREGDPRTTDAAQGPGQSVESPAPAARGAGDTTGGEYVPPALLSWNVPRSVRRGFRGRVVALIEVDASGQATSVRLEAGTGNQTFDARLKEALQQARYEPARLQGKAVGRSLLQPIDFN